MNRKARRAQKKPESTSVPYGTWNTVQYQKPVEPPQDPQIPGLNIPPVDPEFDAKVARNSWHDRDELIQVMETILNLSQPEKYQPDGNTLKPGLMPWTWGRNTKCKYINLRIDMRDGGFTLSHDGGRINLEQLKWQYKSIPQEET